MDAHESEGLEGVWRDVLSDWENEKAHESFQRLAWARGELGRAAACYRGQLDDPERGELAAKRMNAVVLFATHVLEGSKTPRSSVPRWIVGLAVVICMLALGLLCWTLVF